MKAISRILWLATIAVLFSAGALVEVEENGSSNGWSKIFTLSGTCVKT